MGQILQNKPLVEALFELRWGHSAQEGDNPPRFDDPNYQILLGRLFDAFQDQGYPFHERLPGADIPDFMSGHLVQHRFRVAESAWPLVQLGKGILTVNDGENYNWDEDFFNRCLNAVRALHKKYPGDLTSLPFQSISLKYIDAYEFDYEALSVFDFLRSKMRLEMRLPDKLLATAGVTGNPANLLSDFAFDLPAPPGKIRFKIGRGKRTDDKRDLLIWETEVQSMNGQVPTDLDATAAWLLAAHTISSDWFRTLIEGDLLKEFE